MRARLALLMIGLSATSAVADAACQDYVKLDTLPKEFKTISVSVIGPAKLSMMSNGPCTCNDMPSVQRHLGQEEPEGVNWACFPSGADETKAR